MGEDIFKVSIDNLNLVKRFLCFSPSFSFVSKNHSTKLLQLLRSNVLALSNNAKQIK